MPGNRDLTVVSCRRLGDDYVLLTRDLDTVHAWGGRAEMLRADVPQLALEIADASGSARLTTPPTAGPYPWFVQDIQQRVLVHRPRPRNGVLRVAGRAAPADPLTLGGRGRAAGRGPTDRQRTDTKAVCSTRSLAHQMNSATCCGPVNPSPASSSRRSFDHTASRPTCIEVRSTLGRCSP